MATFNLWNNEDTWLKRREEIVKEILSLNADIIAFQEVPCLQEIDFISESVGKYDDYNFMKYQDEDEGLAIFSKYPITQISKSNDILNQCAQRITVEIDGLNVGITNVHLTWKSVLKREEEIIEVINWISKTNATDYELLCGDFNSRPNLSSIYNFLVGEISINSIDTSWIDLGQSLNYPTLDFRNNSWLHNRDNLNNIRVPVRYDWIFLKSCFPKKEPKLLNINVFANGKTSSQQFLPSDHYGVYVDLNFEEELH
jgi:maltose 6'-phosphate phosphatase